MKLIKHPLIIFLILPIIVGLGGFTVMMHLTHFFDVPQYVQIIVIIIFVIFFIIWFFAFNKALKAEEKTTLKRIKQCAHTDKTFTLIQRRAVLANITIFFGGLAIYFAWLVFLPIEPYNHYGYWLFRVFSIIITVLGFIFSFITPQKMLIYQHGQLIVTTDTQSLTIKPSELINYKLIQSYPQSKSKARRRCFDVVLHLSNDNIVLKKADYTMFFSKILKTIKEIESDELT